MPALILPLVDAATHWPARGALVGLDLGTKTIGVAVSDPDRRLATGVETVQRKQFKQDAARLLAIAAERKAAGFVLGLPINMDGSEGPRAKLVRNFADRIAARTGRQVRFQDERLTSSAADWAMARSGLTHKQKKERRDALAAAAVLTDFLAALPKPAEGGAT